MKRGVQTLRGFGLARFGVASVVLAFALAGGVSTAGAAPVLPQQPSASASSSGVTQDASLNTTYLYGPLNESSSSGPVSVATPSTGCGVYSLCTYSGGILASGAAHASPGGDLGVSANGQAPDGSTYHPYAFPDNAPVVHSNASFANSAVVRSALDPVTHQPLLADGTPVQVTVSLELDGKTGLYANDYTQAALSAGGFTSSSDLSASFNLIDPAITGSGETAGIAQQLIQFQADANGVNGGYVDSATNKFIPEQSLDRSWTFTSNHGDNLSGGTSFTCDGNVQHCASAFVSGTVPAGITGSPLSYYFSTGVQSVTLDTQVGHTLDWNGTLDVLNQAYGATAAGYSGFYNTFGVNLNPVSSEVSLDFSYPQQPLQPVPEPSSLALLGGGLFAVAAERWRGGTRGGA